MSWSFLKSVRGLFHRRAARQQSRRRSINRRPLRRQLSFEPLEDRCLPSGGLYVANSGDNTIHHFSATGADLGGFAANGSKPVGVVFDNVGNLYVSLYNDNTIRKFSPTGTDLGIIANTGLANPGGMVFDANGNLYVENYNYPDRNGFGGYIRELSSTGTDLGVIVSGIATNDFLTRDGSGNLYVGLVSPTNHIEQYSATGADLGEFAPTFRHPNGLAFDTSGNLYVATTPVTAIQKFSGTGEDLGVLPDTGLDGPRGIAFDSDGNLYAANFGNNTIRKFTSMGDDLGNFATTGLSEPYGLAFSPFEAPTVQSVQVNDGSVQRSMVNSLTVTFSTIVTLDPGAFEVHHQNGDLVTVNFTSGVVGGQTVAVLTFAGSEIIGGSLADGNYTLIVVADHVHDANGFSPDADTVTSFYRLYGDTQGHRTVDATDVAVLFGTFGKHAGEDGFVSYLDYNGDGVIDDTDLYAFIARYGTTLDPP